MTLDDTGYVHCAYLGTDPSMMVTPAPEARDINYEVCKVLGLQECRLSGVSFMFSAGGQLVFTGETQLKMGITALVFEL